jgi:hypothetical protein
MSLHTDFQLQNISTVKTQFILFQVLIHLLVSYKSLAVVSQNIWTVFFPVFYHLVKDLTEPSAMSIGDGDNFFQDIIVM